MIIMLCAAELLVMREKAEEEWQEEQIRLNAKCALEFIKITEDTIKFCEEVIGKALEEKAKTRKELIVEYSTGKEITDRLGHQLFQLLHPDGQKYANGTKSSEPAGEIYSINVLKEYLKTHCITVESKPIFYYKYDYGKQSGNLLIIKAE